MIHSLAGGVLQESTVFDLAKVKILQDEKIVYYVCDNKMIKPGDIVKVPYGPIDLLTEAEVLRIDKNVNSKNFPIKYDNLKHI